MIVPPVVTPAKSERVEKEQQVPLFTDLPGDSTLPPISLLDAAPAAQETISRRYARIHLAADREEAEGFRRRSERGRRLSGPGRHALRNRAGHRREGQPDRRSGEGSGALAVAGVDSRGRDDSGQEFHGAGVAEPAPPDRESLRDSRLGGLCRRRLAADHGPRQGHRRQAGVRRSREDAALAGGRHDRLGQVGRDQRDDPVAALQGERRRRSA